MSESSDGIKNRKRTGSQGRGAWGRIGGRKRAQAGPSGRKCCLDSCVAWTLASPPASGLRGICGDAGAHGGIGPGSLKLSTRGFVPQEALPDPFEHLLQRIARRPKPQQFFGLMGKRDAGERSDSHYQAV